MDFLLAGTNSIIKNNNNNNKNEQETDGGHRQHIHFAAPCYGTPDSDPGSKRNGEWPKAKRSSDKEEVNFKNIANQIFTLSYSQAVDAHLHSQG